MSCAVSVEALLAALPEDVQFKGVWRHDGTWKDFLVGLNMFYFDPVYGFRPLPSTALIEDRGGERFLYVTDHDGFITNRLTFATTSERIRDARSRRKRVAFLLGGSTVFGCGTTFPHETLAACLEKELNDGGDDWIVVNAGVGGYSTDNQVRYLIYKCLAFSPDVVVFYDGWNDSGYLNGLVKHYGAAYEWGRTQQSYALIERNALLLDPYQCGVYALRLLARILCERCAGIPLCGPLLHKRAKRMIPALFRNPLAAILDVKNPRPGYLDMRAVEFYDKNVNFANSICAANGIAFMHCLQPVLVDSSKPLTASEERWAKRVSSHERDEVIAFYDAYESTHMPKHRFADISLRKSFKDVDEELFVDVGHVNVAGNRIVAREIGAAMSERFK